MGWCSKWSLGTSRGYILIEHLHWFLHTYIEQLEVILYTIDFGKSACISTNTIVNTLKTLSALTAAEKANCWRVYNIFAGHTLLCNKSGWWFQTFFFHSIWDNPSHWLSYFSRWVETTKQKLPEGITQEFLKLLVSLGLAAQRPSYLKDSTSNLTQKAPTRPMLRS